MSSRYLPKRADRVVREYYQEHHGWGSLNVVGKLLCGVGLLSIIFTSASLRVLFTPTCWEFSFRDALSMAIKQQEQQGSVGLEEIIESQNPPFSRSELRKMLLMAQKEGLISTKLTFKQRP